jgi:hypothetical protein
MLLRIEPIVHETLIVQISEPSWALHPSLLHALKYKPGSFEKNVRNVLLLCPELRPAYTVADVCSDLVLSTCRAVRNLVILVPAPFMIRHLEFMQLQRLHIALWYLDPNYNADFTFPFLTTALISNYTTSWRTAEANSISQSHPSLNSAI